MRCHWHLLKSGQSSQMLPFGESRDFWTNPTSISSQDTRSLMIPWIFITTLTTILDVILTIYLLCDAVSFHLAWHSHFFNLSITVLSLSHSRLQVLYHYVNRFFVSIDQEFFGLLLILVGKSSPCLLIALVTKVSVDERREFLNSRLSCLTKNYCSSWKRSNKREETVSGIENEMKWKMLVVRNSYPFWNERKGKKWPQLVIRRKRSDKEGKWDAGHEYKSMSSFILTPDNTHWEWWMISEEKRTTSSLFPRNVKDVQWSLTPRERRSS